MRSKTFMSKINLQRGKLTVENRKSREKGCPSCRQTNSVKALKALNQGVAYTINVLGEGASVGGTNVRTHVVSWHMRVQRYDKLSSAAA